MSTYLDRILAAHRRTAARDTRNLESLIDEAAAMPTARGFRASLARTADGGALAVIAEVKRRSPSKGDLRIDLDPDTLARSYEQGGAACLSVLTDEEFFAGSSDDLRRARAAGTLPVLRKDFTVDPRDVCDARLMGADCVLLIVAALSRRELVECLRVATAVAIDVLVEVHDEPELEVAIEAGADLIGVNQRDLVTFEVDTERAVRMAPLMPSGVIRVAESGIHGVGEAAELARAGYHAVLVGEHLVTAGDPAGEVAALRRARSS